MEALDPLPPARRYDRWAFWLVVAGVLSAQQACDPGGFRPARVCTGDEPHYLVILNSVLNGFDLDLSNEYLAVHRGGFEAGIRHQSRGMDHHTVLRLGGRTVPFVDLFESRWKARADNEEALHPPRPGAPAAPLGSVERPVHPPGIALVAPLLWPARGTAWVEPLALLLSALSVILGAWAALDLGRRLLPASRPHPVAVGLAVLGGFLATAAWHYSRSFFNEPFLLGAALGAYALYGRGRVAPAALLLVLGAQMKPPFLILAVPLWIDALWRRDTRAAITLSLAAVVATGAVLGTNAWLYGDPLTPPQPFRVGNPLQGAAGLLMSWNKGMWTLSPILVLAAGGWVNLLRARSRMGALCLSGFLAYFAVMATWEGWHGATCFGPRLIVPVLPLFALGLVGLREYLTRIPVVGVTVALLALSVAMNAHAAYSPCMVQDLNPLDQWFLGAKRPGR